MSEMRFLKDKRNRNYNWVFNDEDPLYGDWKPNFSKAEDSPNKFKDLHPELRKMLFSDLYEKPDDSFVVENERDA